MNKKSVKKILSLIMLIFLIYGANSSIGNAGDGIPEKIRVGLYFTDATRNISNAVFSVDIASPTGMEIVHKTAGYSEKLASFSPGQKMTVRKDAWFVKDGSRYVEYTTDRVPSSGEKHGPYHIRTGAIYGSRENADRIVEMLRGNGIAAFLVYDGRWYVWSGFYPDLDSANNAVGGVRSKSENYKCSVVKNTQAALIVESTPGNPYVAYIQKSGVLMATPVEGKGLVPALSVNGKPYRGTIEVYRLPGSDITVVNEVKLDEYLYGVVPREMYSGSHIEALKAQAVAARTYAVRNAGKFSNLNFNLSSGTSCQAYEGYSIETTQARKAVNETSDEIVTYNGQPAATYYFSSSGGRTADVRNVWGGNDYPYLVSVEDVFEDGNSIYYNWEAEYTAKELADELKSKSIDVGQISSISVDRVSESGRVVKLSVTGSRGNKTFTNSSCRTFLRSLYSQMYTVSTDADVKATSAEGSSIKIVLSGKRTITSMGKSSIGDGSITVMGAGGKNRKVSGTATKYIFKGRGWGHGVGMSQEGARGMAKAGYGYRDILMHYYPGTDVE